MTANIQEIQRLDLPGLEICNVIHRPRSEGNKVYQCEALLNRDRVNVFLKVSRYGGSSLKKEVEVLKALEDSEITTPRLLSYSLGTPASIATEAIEGKHVSTILKGLNGKDKEHESIAYARKFGESLGRIHRLELDWGPRSESFFDRFLDDSALADSRFLELDRFLTKHRPRHIDYVFVHGDHHYGNVLWREGEVIGVLDWEACGTGWREHDIARMMIVRFGQDFFHSEECRESFLEGYRKYSRYSEMSIIWNEIRLYLDLANKARIRCHAEFMEFTLGRARNLASRI